MDDQLKKLLGGHLLAIPSKNFTARTMQKIREIHEGQRIKRNSRREFNLPPLAASVLLWHSFYPGSHGARSPGTMYKSGSPMSKP